MEFFKDQLVLVMGDARAVVDHLNAPAIQASGRSRIITSPHLFRAKFHRVG
jgi:hypothetical protein